MVRNAVSKIQGGTYLRKIRNDAFNGDEGENTYEHINKFLDITNPIKINGWTQDRFRLSIFLVSLTGAAHEWFTKECMGSIATWDSMVEEFIFQFHHLSDHNNDEEEEDSNETDNSPKIFMIERNLFDFETPLCKTFNEFNYLLKIDIDIFTYDIQNFKAYYEYKQEGTDESWSENKVPYQLCDHICEPYLFKNGNAKWPTCTSDIDGFCNGGELPGMVRVGSMTYFQDHIWYNELADGKLKEETLALKTKIEGSWGDATPGVLKFRRWLKGRFNNFHELEYEENFKRGPYANIKTEWGNNPPLDANHIFERDREASNVGCNQEDQGHKDDPIPNHQTARSGRLGVRFSPRGQTDAQRAALWHAISDIQGENRDLRLQLAEERRARLELAEVVDNMRRGQEPRGGA
ncbi:hypothetical protein Tco_0308084 [Tanacetum coccineum]